MADDTMENTLQRNEDPPSYESTIHLHVSNASAIQTKDARRSPKLMATPSPGAHPDRPHESVTPFRHHPPYPYHHFHPIANKYLLGNKGDYHQENHTFPPYHYPPPSPYHYPWLYNWEPHRSRQSSISTPSSQVTEPGKSAYGASTIHGAKVSLEWGESQNQRYQTGRIG